MIRAKVEGLAELHRQLQALGKKSISVLRKAGITAMEPVVEDMRQHAGYDVTSTEEHMRDSIKIYANTESPTLVTIRVLPGKKHRIKARAQELGTIKQAAKPFIRPALDYNKTLVLRRLAIAIREQIKNR